MRVLFVDNTEGHNPKELYTKPTGGTLTSLTKVPEYLASIGHDVYVASTYKVEEVVNKVHYIRPQAVIPKWDVTVFNRNMLLKDLAVYGQQQGTKNVWWLHDLVDLRYLEDDAFKMLDSIVALSQYCKDTFSDFYEIDPGKFEIIPNGVDPEVFYPGEYGTRNPHLFISASAPIKGQIALEPTYLSLKNHDLDVDFRIYSSQSLHHRTDAPEHTKFLKGMVAAGAHVYAPTSQKVMATLMRRAWALLMPNMYPEICSNLLLQARACGLPVVASSIGANKEFIEHNKTGLLTTKWNPHELHSWVVEFARQACTIQRDKELHQNISAAAPVGVLTWDQVGEAWNELLHKLVAKI
jgi:glycosyltransferase involved in cell wall biosynthesis